MAWDGGVVPRVKMTPHGGLKGVLNVPRHGNNAIQLKKRRFQTFKLRAGSEKMKPFCDVKLHFCFHPITMCKIEERHPYISKCFYLDHTQEPGIGTKVSINVPCNVI